MYSEYSYICSEYIYIYIHMYSEYSYICSEYIYIYIKYGLKNKIDIPRKVLGFTQNNLEEKIVEEKNGKARQ